MNESAATGTGAATSWTDVFGMVIATTSVLITVLTVIVAWHLSRNYLQSVKEMQDLRTSSEDLSRQVRSLTDINSSLLRESMLAVRTIFDLMMAMERREKHRQIRDQLVATKAWKGRDMADEEIVVYTDRISIELDKVAKDVAARQTELYWLVGQSTERAAHLQALATTNGDHRTIDLLESVRQSRTNQDERDELLVAVASLRQRLGRPSKLVGKRHNSGTWTGR